MGGLKPLVQLYVAALENRSDRDRELALAGAATMEAEPPTP